MCKPKFTAKCWQKLTEVLITPASRAQPHVTEARLALSSGIGDYPEIRMHVPILFRTSMYIEECVHILPRFLRSGRNFTMKMETVGRGWAGRKI